MSDDPRVDKLLEELLESGKTPEEICRDNPELLAKVCARLKQLRALEAEIDALFPQSAPSSDGESTALPAADLPRIRGYEVQKILGRGGMGAARPVGRLERLAGWARRRPVSATVLAAILLLALALLGVLLWLA